VNNAPDHLRLACRIEGVELPGGIQSSRVKLALQMARDDYETRRERQRQGVRLAKAVGKYAGRKADTGTHQHNRRFAYRRQNH